MQIVRNSIALHCKIIAIHYHVVSIFYTSRTCSCTVRTQLRLLKTPRRKREIWSYWPPCTRIGGGEKVGELGLILQGPLPAWRMPGEMPYADVCASRLASVHVFRSVSNTRYRRSNLSTLRVRAQFSSLLASRFPDVSIRVFWLRYTITYAISPWAKLHRAHYTKLCSSFRVWRKFNHRTFHTLFFFFFTLSFSRATDIYVLFSWNNREMGNEVFFLFFFCIRQ